jgi:hypothetical protein
MALSSAQYVALKDAIAADQVLAAKPQNDDGAFDIARALNLPASPTFYVYRTLVDVNEVMQNGFDWTRVDGLTDGKARIWEWMMHTGELHPHQANVRAGVIEAFKVAGDLATRQAVFNHFQRPATRAEKLFATGSGTTVNDQGVGPATMGFEGELSTQDVAVARNS